MTPVPKGMMNFDELTRQVSEGIIDTVLVCFPDMFGRLVGKRFHARFFVEKGFKETHACDYLLADDIDMEPVPGYEAANWAAGYGDFTMQPDMSTLRRIPWLDGTVMVLCDVVDHHHEPVPHSPRAILRRQIERLTKRGWTAMSASELEFYLFDESFRAISDRGFRNPRTSGTYIQDYHILQTTREEPVLRAMRNGLEGAGIPVENSKGEWGPGQEELNIEYCEALDMADRHVIMKNGMKEIADEQGKAITFMAKWNDELAGNSCHIHMSLQDESGSNVFFDPEQPHGMSAVMQQFLAGQLAHAEEITYFLAPFINSYKRFQAGTFAPTKTVWSIDNRTAGFRLCGEQSHGIRIECRIGGADLNPYLAFAVLIAAGLEGVDRSMELEPAYKGDAYSGDALQDVPRTLRDTIICMEQSTWLRDALGEDVINHYLHTARWEQGEYDRRVTDWELQRGFERS